MRSQRAAIGVGNDVTAGADGSLVHEARLLGRRRVHRVDDRCARHRSGGAQPASTASAPRAQDAAPASRVATPHGSRSGAACRASPPGGRLLDRGEHVVDRGLDVVVAQVGGAGLRRHRALALDHRGHQRVGAGRRPAVPRLPCRRASARWPHRWHGRRRRSCRTPPCRRQPRLQVPRPPRPAWPRGRSSWILSSRALPSVEQRCARRVQATCQPTSAPRPQALARKLQPAGPADRVTEPADLPPHDPHPSANRRALLSWPWLRAAGAAAVALIGGWRWAPPCRSGCGRAVPQLLFGLPWRQGQRQEPRVRVAVDTAARLHVGRVQAGAHARTHRRWRSRTAGPARRWSAGRHSSRSTDIDAPGRATCTPASCWASTVAPAPARSRARGPTAAARPMRHAAQRRPPRPLHPRAGRHDDRSPQRSEGRPPSVGVPFMSPTAPPAMARAATAPGRAPTSSTRSRATSSTTVARALQPHGALRRHQRRPLRLARCRPGSRWPRRSRWPTWPSTCSSRFIVAAPPQRPLALRRWRRPRSPPPTRMARPPSRPRVEACARSMAPRRCCRRCCSQAASPPSAAATSHATRRRDPSPTATQRPTKPGARSTTSAAISATATRATRARSPRATSNRSRATSGRARRRTAP